MHLMDIVILIITGLLSGALAGILGLGGGIFLVPVLVACNYAPVNAVATSGIPVSMAAISAVITHSRSGQLCLLRALRIGAIAAIAAQGGVFLAHYINSRLLLVLFALFLVTNIGLMHFGRNHANNKMHSDRKKLIGSELVIGLVGGSFSGFFGVGGGVVLVPLLVLLAAEPLKNAVRTSMAVVLVSALSSIIGHAFRGSVLWDVGVFLAVGSLVGAQIGAVLLPMLTELFIHYLFVGSLSLIAIFIIIKSF